jgi:hypothetical protein
MTTPMSTPHVGETIDVQLSNLTDERTGEAVTGATITVVVDAPSGTDPTPTAPSEVSGVYWSSFVAAVEGEHVVKTQAVKDGRIFRHRQIVEVEPW